MAKTVSGKQVIKILIKHFGFQITSQKGSHVKLKKRIGNTAITTIVPDHKELARGTLKSILKLAKVDKDEFWRQV